MSAPAERGFATLAAAQAPVVDAPDGSRVQVLLSLQGGSMATFTLQPGQVSAAVAHRTVEELWYVVAGRGRMWRRNTAREETVALEPGLCLSVPLGTAFQFRCDGDVPLVAVAVTMPPWPGADEAMQVKGHWEVASGVIEVVVPRQDFRAQSRRTSAHVSRIHHALADALSESFAIERLLPGMLARAAEKRGLDLPVHELNSVAAAMLTAKGDRLDIDLDLPCALGATEQHVEATLQGLVDELVASLPSTEEALLQAVSDAVPQALHEIAALISGELKAKTVTHAEHLAEAQAQRARAVATLWGRALEYLDLIRHLVLEWSEDAVALGKGRFSNPNTSFALSQLASRAYEVVGEIITLARAGYADGALARWRSLHEICVVTMFIAQRADRCALMYLSHHKVEELRLLKIDRASGTSGILTLHRDRYTRDLLRQVTRLVDRFGEAFAGDYGWAAVELGHTKVRFRDLEAIVGLDTLRRGYQRANATVHGGALATLSRISVSIQANAASHLPLVHGCELAAEYAIASLTMLVADLCLDTEDADLLTSLLIIQKCAEEARSSTDESRKKTVDDSPRARLLVRRAAQKISRTRPRPTFRR